MAGPPESTTGPVQLRFRAIRLDRNMGWTMHRLIAGTLAVLLLQGAGVSVAKAQVGCLSQTETVSAVRDGQVMPFEEVVPRDMRTPSGFLGVRLCEDNGVLVYVVSTLTGSGRVTHVAVDARSGRIVGKR
jgi:hypothetical protein